MCKATRLLGILGVAALVIAVVTPVSANCLPAKTATTFTTGLAYWDLPAGAVVNEASLRGQFWQKGNRAGGNEGTCTPQTCGVGGPWIYFLDGRLNMNLNLGDANVAGCPVGILQTTVQVDSADGKHTYNIAGTVNEAPAGSGQAVDFAYGLLGDQLLAAIPKPTILSSSRAGSVLTLHMGIPDASGGAFGPGASTAIAGYRLVSGNGTGANDPGRTAAAYTLLQQTAGPVADITQAIDCTGVLLPNEKFVGVQIVYSDGVISPTSSTYRVGCDPTLADPKFKIVPKKNVVNSKAKH